jgi:hypothetical protein
MAMSTQAPQPATGYTLTIAGTLARWHVTSDSSWIKLSATSGTGPGTVTVTADSSAQRHGSFTGSVTVTDDHSGTSQSVQATLSARSPKLVVSPTSATFSVDTTTTASALSEMVLVTDELNGAAASEAASWTLQSLSAPWLQWTPSSGSSSPSANSTLSLVTSELVKLAPGPYTATVTLGYQTADGTSGTVSFPVTLSYKLASVSFVGPYIGLANQPGWLYVRGAGFTAVPGSLTVSIGSTDVAGATPDSDTQVRVSYPALAAGTYPVSIKNQLGLVVTKAQLVVLTPPSLAYQAIGVSTTRQRLVYDAERTTLYGVNASGQAIEVYQLANGAWSAAAPFVLANLTDIALTPNGRSLIVLTQQEVNEMALPIGAGSVSQPRAPNPTSFCGQYLASLAMLNDGRAAVNSLLSGCSGFTPIYLYDVTSYSFVQGPYPSATAYDGLLGGAADGSKIFFGTKNVSPAQAIGVISALNDSFSSNNSVSYNLIAVTVSGDASRVILNSDVYDGSLNLLAHMPASASKVLLSRDSTRAYAYNETANGAELDIYDLTGALGIGAIYPLLKTVTLADLPNAETQNFAAIQMAETPDGKVVFVSGDKKIIVQPVN